MLQCWIPKKWDTNMVNVTQLPRLVHHIGYQCSTNISQQHTTEIPIMESLCFFLCVNKHFDLKT